MDRTSSPAFEVLRPSSRKLLAYVEREIERQGGGGATLYNDQLAVVGSIKVVQPGLSELHALGLIEVVRLIKRYDCRLSSRWRDIASMREAMLISIRARHKRIPAMTVPPQPASVSGPAA